jgi:dihydrofolate synthase/folylpolyglutamate synthase
MRTDAILKRLLALHPNKLIDLKLNRIEALLEKLGNPQDNLPPTIHVAGTNGKGSTIAHLRAMLEAGGKKIHVYTSPHLVSFRERIRLAGELISEKKLNAALEHCENLNEGLPITYFEITTAAAFYLFAKEKADYLLLEVGLGGRFDATNVIDNPLGTIITPISIDHVEFLGDNLADIAKEKAGILKRNSPAVIARQQIKALDMLKKQAKILDVKPFIAGVDFDGYQQNNRLIYQDEKGLMDLPPSNLKGQFQYENASIAIAAIRHFKLPIKEDEIAKGLEKTQWAGRFMPINSGALRDILPPSSQLWLDGGHNVAGAEVLVSATEAQRQNRPLIMIMAAFANKDIDGFLKHFIGKLDKFIAIEMKSERNIITSIELAKKARVLGFTANHAASIKQALKQAASIENAMVLICGSLHLVGEVLAENKTLPK